MAARLVVVTGGPGAGKTALLQMARRHFCRHVAVLPEAATIVYGGGFPRHTGDAAQRAAQRAIFHVQRQLERMTLEEGQALTILCDRGTVDGLAYWQGLAETFWRDVGSTPSQELARYDVVIHMHPPRDHEGYDHSNPLRIESAKDAQAIDERIAEAWSAHPRRFFVEHTPDFRSKVSRALDLIGQLVAPCECSAARAVAS